MLLVFYGGSLVTTYKVNFEARPSFDLFNFAKLSLSLYKKANDNQLAKYYLVSGLLHTASAFEAMINHYGNVLFQDWENETYKLGRTQTDKMLFKKVGLCGFTGDKNYQKIASYFKLRDFMMHAKSSVESSHISIIDNATEDYRVDKINSISHSKIESLTIEKLSEFIDLVEKVQWSIEDKAEYPDFHEFNELKFSECPLGVSGLRMSN